MIENRRSILLARVRANFWHRVVHRKMCSVHAGTMIQTPQSARFQFMKKIHATRQQREAREGKQDPATV